MGETTVCANINAKGRRRRLVAGVVALAAAAALQFLVEPHNDAGNVRWRIAEFALLGYGWLCVIQALKSTCVVLAARGVQETDAGTARIDDAAIAAALRRRARVVWIMTAIAVVLTFETFALLGNP